MTKKGTGTCPPGPKKYIDYTNNVQQVHMSLCKNHPLYNISYICAPSHSLYPNYYDCI